MSQENVPLLIVTAPPQNSDDRSREIHLPYIGLDQNMENHPNKTLKLTPGAFKRAGSFKSGAKKALNLKHADKSEPLRKIEINNSYNNMSLLSIEKKINDEVGTDNVSLSSRSIFSTESPRDLKGAPSLKQKSYYLGVISQNDSMSTQIRHLKASYATKSEIHDTTLDKSNSNLLTHHKPEGERKCGSKVQSMNQIQSKRSSSLDPKFYHGFRKSYISQNLNDQAESYEVSQVHSPHQKNLQLPIGDIDKFTEEEHNVPRPPPRNKAKITKASNPSVLDHRRPKKVSGETSSLVMKTNTDLDNKTMNSLPVDNTPYSVMSLTTFESNQEVVRLNSDPDWAKHRKLRPNIGKEAALEPYMSNKTHKENYGPFQTDFSTGQSSQLDIKMPLRPSATNAMTKPLRRNLNSKAQTSEARASSREDLMRRFNEIVTYSSNPAPQANPQTLGDKNNQNSRVMNIKDKENNGKKPLKQQDENKPTASVPKNKKPVEIAGTDAKILVLKSKIKDSEMLRKKNKNHRYEEAENTLNGLPLKNKLNEINENRENMEEETKKKLLVMRKIQLYDILIKQKVGKKLSKEALRLVKAEFDKVTTELDELKAI